MSSTFGCVFPYLRSWLLMWGIQHASLSGPVFSFPKFLDSLMWPMVIPRLCLCLCQTVQISSWTTCPLRMQRWNKKKSSSFWENTQVFETCLLASSCSGLACSAPCSFHKWCTVSRCVLLHFQVNRAQFAAVLTKYHLEHYLGVGSGLLSFFLYFCRFMFSVGREPVAYK